MEKRQFGFAFILFVPYLAYWGYDIWLRLYRSLYDRFRINPDDCTDGRAETHLDLPTTDNDSSHQSLTPDDYRRAFYDIQEGVVTPQHCSVLTAMVRSADQDTVENGLKLLEMISVKSSAESKKAIFDGKVPNELVRLVKSRCVFSDAVVRKLLVVINNLSMSEDLPQIFGEMVTDLLDITILSDDLSLLALQCLTNISVTPTCHNAFTRTVQSLYNLLDSQLERRVGILRVLINLSANQDFVVYLLSAKKPQCSTRLFEEAEQVSSRWLRFLANVCRSALTLNITETSLPVLYKAASPETFYSYLYGSSSQSDVCNQLLSMNNFHDGESRDLANAVYRSIKLKSLAPR